MIISTCGFGSTGSSAVSDYLLECDETECFDAVEFTIATMVDGLEDLEYHLIKQHSRLDSSIYAIQRFKKAIMNHSKEWGKSSGVPRKAIIVLTEKYIEKITQLSFVGVSPMIDKRHNEFLRHYVGESIIQHRIVAKLEQKKILNHNIDVYPLDRVRASINPKNFYKETRWYVKSLLRLLGAYSTKAKHIILDQAFSGDNPAKSFRFFDDPWAIVVDRDPRDVYIFAKRFLLHRGRFMPTNDVNTFIQYYRMLRKNQPYLKKNDRVLFVQFEDMIYDYEKTTDRINHFLHLNNNHKQTIFIPEMSAANTNLVRKFPELTDDVQLIEKKLPEYLYDFESVKDRIVSSGDMFFGKSPKNVK